MVGSEKKFAYVELYELFSYSILDIVTEKMLGSVGCASTWYSESRWFDPFDWQNVLSWRLVMKPFLLVFSAYH